MRIMEIEKRVVLPTGKGWRKFYQFYYNGEPYFRSGVAGEGYVDIRRGVLKEFEFNPERWSFLPHFLLKREFIEEDKKIYFVGGGNISKENGTIQVVEDFPWNAPGLNKEHFEKLRPYFLQKIKKIKYL